MVAAAAAVALAVHILACVRHHLDFDAEIFRIGGIHNALVIPEGIAIGQQGQRLGTVACVDSLFKGAAPQVGNALHAAEGNLFFEDRLSLDSDIQVAIVGCIGGHKGHAVQDQLAFCRGAVDALIQRAVFQGEAAHGEVAHVQAFQGMALQIQDHILVACRGVGRVKASMDHVLRQVEGSTNYQIDAHLSRADSGSILHGVVYAVLAHQQRLRAARFSALLAGAVRVRPFMCAGVDRQGDGVGIDAVAAAGQGAVDLGGKQPGLVGHLGQFATREKILKEKFVPGAVIQLPAALQLPLIGNVLGQPLGPRGSHLDFLVALPGIQIPALTADEGILGLGGDGDGRTENGDGEGLGGQCFRALGICGSELQLIGALLHGVLGRDDYGLIDA